jgi:hypothetical protein
MMSETRIVLNTVVAGFLPDKPELVIADIKSALALVNSAVQLGIRSSKDPSQTYEMRFLSSPQLADAYWLTFAQENNIPFHVVAADEHDEDKQTTEFMNRACSSMLLNHPKERWVTSKGITIDILADQADLAIILWRGKDENSHHEVFDMMQACKRRGISSIWINPNTPGVFHWVHDSYFEVCDEKKLNDYLLDMLFSKEDSQEKVPSFRLPGLWRKLYSRFMDKYKAQVKIEAYEKDTMLGEDYSFTFDNQTSASNRCALARFFHKYDKAAIDYAERYRASIYFRAIVPMYITIFLAFGFYTETLFSFFYAPKLPYVDLSPWAIIAGIGFLLHALFNYFIYKVSLNPAVKAWQKHFLENRFIAEVLRLSVHFIPFGFFISRSNTGDRVSLKSKINKNSTLAHELRYIQRNCVDFPQINYDGKVSAELLQNLRNMLEDQMNYQQRTAKRYEIVTRKLTKYAQITFTAGLIFILLRGGVQFLLVPLNMDVLSNGAHLNNFVKTLANTIALLLPAWATYFTTKLTLCNFAGLQNNAENMNKELDNMKKSVDDIINREDYSYESIYHLSEDIFDLMTGEVKEWYSQLSTRQVTRI